MSRPETDTCKTCGKRYEACCCAHFNNGESEPERPSEGSVTCSEWVAELEAARTHLLVAETIMAEADDYRYEGQLGEAYGALMDILDTERGRSATDEIQRQRGEAGHA